jgi:hypothetical protein
MVGKLVVEFNPKLNEENKLNESKKNQNSLFLIV